MGGITNEAPDAAPNDRMTSGSGADASLEGAIAGQMRWVLQHGTYDQKLKAAELLMRLIGVPK